MKIILIGIQGSGKSTQGNLLQKKLELPYLASGHIFRQLAKEDTQTGKYIKGIMNAGYLIPDEKTLEIVTDYLNRSDYKKGYILDGFPRTVKQAEAFKNGAERVIYLDVSDEEAKKRIATRVNDDNRQDETDEAIKKRIESFHKFTEPVLDYYRSKNLLIEVNGEQSIEGIHDEIMKKLEK
jgi:adenylate kinase